MFTPGLIGAIAAQGGTPPTPPAGPQPTLGAVGPPRHAAGQASVLVTFPSGVSLDHLLILGLLSHNTSVAAITGVPSGFALWTGWGTAGLLTSVGTDLNKIRTRLYWKWALGSESGDTSFSFAANGTFSTIMGRITGANRNLNPPFELFGQELGQGAPMEMPGITTTLPRRLGVSVVGFGNDEAINSFVGGSGPSWTLQGGAANSGGNDRAIAFLTASLASAGASTGHQDTALRANNEWAAGAFAVLPNPTGA